MHVLMTLYVAFLFFVLTPSILVSLPPKGNKFTVAAVHAIIFALIFHFTHNMVWQLSVGGGGFKEGICSQHQSAGTCGVNCTWSKVGNSKHATCHN